MNLHPVDDVRWWITDFRPGSLPLRKLKFLVASTGRSGSRWIANVYNQLGLACGHEYVFPMKYQPRWNDQLVGESSWGAVPFLRSIPCLIFHQVRHPLDVVNSLAGNNYLREGDPSPYSQFKRLFLDLHPTDCVLAAMQVWTGWNKLIDPYSVMRWRLEDLDGETLSIACRHAGFIRTPSACQTLIDATGPVNGHKRNTLTLDDLPDGEDKKRMLDLAYEYGYEV